MFEYGDTIIKVRDDFKYVATVGVVGDWAVYHNYYYVSDDDVARNGDKVSKHKACELFPELSHLQYRA
jgi:hypothetical protein